MRLSEQECSAISQAAAETLPTGTHVSLFGSRTNNARRVALICWLKRNKSSQLLRSKVINTEKLKVAVREADRHTQALCMEQQDWDKQTIPLSIEAIEQDPELVRLADQILFRFAKLQDTLGQRLIPATLAELREPYEEWSMQDRLNKLEKLGFLEVISWLEWREIRNRLAHEYPNDSALRLANLEAAIKASQKNAENYRQWRAQLVQRNSLQTTLRGMQ